MHYYVTVTLVIFASCKGQSFPSFSSFTIASAVSIPSVTSPNTVYWRSKNALSVVTMKNCEPALLGDLTDGMETAYAIVKLEKDGNSLSFTGCKDDQSYGNIIMHICMVLLAACAVIFIMHEAYAQQQLAEPAK